MEFRHWLQQKWFEHCEEVETWEKRPPCYGAKEYFKKYRWWLRREFRRVTLSGQI
jgi:hypothetical protein